MSVAQFAPDRPWVAVGVGLAGLALRRNLRHVEGAFGLWLWSTPGLLRPRSGSVPLWIHADDPARGPLRPGSRAAGRAVPDRATGYLRLPVDRHRR